MPSGGELVRLIRMLVALQMLLLPAYVAAVSVGGAGRLGRRILAAPAPVVLLGGAMLVLAALVGGGIALAVLKAQALALGLVVLVAGLAAAGRRLGGERFGQVLAAAIGWLLVGSFLAAGPVVELLQGPAAAWLVGAAAHASPLLVAERELGLDWLHAGLTYRLSPFGESYDLYIYGLAAWKTTLVHLFIGSGLLVFAGPGRRRAEAPPASAARA